MWRPTVWLAPTTGVRSGERCSSMGVGTATMITAARARSAGLQVYSIVAAARASSVTSLVRS